MIQNLINHLYRYPLSKWKRIQRFGGLISYSKMMAGRRNMVKTSLLLPPIQSTPGGYKIYFLTGRDYLYQTLFCARSLIKTSETSFQFILVDDGSFNEELITRAKNQMPGVEIITKSAIAANLESRLPIKDFPYLHEKRKVYPHIKKLTDIHTIDDEEYKLVLDADMLFWHEPTEIINWLKKPDSALHMVDCEESYGYEKNMMESLCKAKVPDLVNVGAIGLNSKSINWMDVEYWARTLEETSGASYFLEQALSAMIIANQERTVLAAESYIVNPKNGKERQKTLGHYVDLSKKDYFNHCWKLILNG